MNENLAVLNAQIADFRIGAESLQRFPKVFVIGLPRCGSALFQQCMISMTDIGYVSNVMGKMWTNPAAGYVLHLSLAPDDYLSNFKSSFGNTEGPFEPCEYGWFWRKVLNAGGDDIAKEPIDWDMLSNLLDDLSAVAKRSFLFDTPFANSLISCLSDKLVDSKFIYFRRNPFYICNSILNARVKKNGTLYSCYGARAVNVTKKVGCDHSDPVQDVVLQVFDLMREIEDARSMICQPDRWLELDVEELWRDPKGVVTKAATFSGVQLKNQPSLAPFENRNRRDFVNEEVFARLELFYSEIFGDCEKYRV